MLDPRVTIHWMAKINYLELRPEDRAALDEAVTRLVGTDPAGWPAAGLVRLTGEPPHYMVSFTPDLRAYVTPTAGGGVEIRDILSRGAVEAFREMARHAGVAP